MRRVRPSGGRADSLQGRFVSAFDDLRARRAAGGVVVLDGAMGTELEARGASMDSDAWCGLVNLQDPGSSKLCTRITSGLGLTWSRRIRS